MQPTFILGGGPSASEVDTARLPGFVLGVNDAAFHKPVHAFFSNDHGYALGIREKIEALTVPTHLAVRQKFHHRFEGWTSKIWHRIDAQEPAMDGRRLSSGPAGTPGCSGYVAVNLAARLGAEFIVLLGYDFDDDYRYFFSEDPYPRVHIAGVINSFRQVAPWYAARNIRVLNANPLSRIDAFDKITLEEAYGIT
jgi:hypothetical protein